MPASHFAIAKSNRAQIARPLKVLIPLIRLDIENGDRAGFQYYADAGSKLLEAEDQISRGRWNAWLQKTFGIQDRQARTWMRAARLRDTNTANGNGTADLPRSLNEMTGQTERDRQRRQRDKAYQTVLRELETDLYAQEKLSRDDEVRLHRELARDVIEVGYKAIAPRLHPDRGGSTEAMARLNRVRAELNSVATNRRFV